MRTDLVDPLAGLLVETNSDVGIGLEEAGGAQMQDKAAEAHWERVAAGEGYFLLALEHGLVLGQQIGSDDLELRQFGQKGGQVLSDATERFG